MLEDWDAEAESLASCGPTTTSNGSNSFNSMPQQIHSFHDTTNQPYSYDRPTDSQYKPRQNRNTFGSSNRSRGSYKNNTFNDRNSNRHQNNRQPSYCNDTGNANYNTSTSNQIDYDSDQHTIHVRNNRIKNIIGRGGINIRDIQHKSSAQIKISRDEDDGYETPVHIIGTADAQKKAVELIEEIINPHQSSQNGASTPSSQSSTPAIIDWKNLSEMDGKYQEERWKDAPKLEKNFYIEDSNVANMHPREVEEIRLKNNNIMVNNLHEKGEGNIPNPVRTFEEALQHYPDVLQLVKRQGFERPSPVQMQAWPIIMKGHDLIGIAQTGTGKTLAFLLPAFIHIEGQPGGREYRGGPQVLVLSPTRELALQIESEVKKFSYKGISCVCVYGGGNRREQMQTVTKGVEIIVATPGRLNDFIMNQVITVNTVTYLVLDEADRMLDLGFEPEIKKILLDIRPDRQTVMTSATWPTGVQRMASQYLKNPMQILVGSLDLTAVHSVTQLVEIIDEEEKRERLLRFIKTEMGANDKVMVFVGRKSMADHLSSDLAMMDITCQCIHGDREQIDREQALDDLKTGEVNILIATDVASRGIDIKDVTHVLNFDFPRNIEEYVHRVGRTGRAGRTGISLTFVTRKDWRSAKELIRILVEANQVVPQELEDMAQRYEAMRERRREEGGERDRGGRFGGGFSNRSSHEGGYDRESREALGKNSRMGNFSGGRRGRGGGRRGNIVDGIDWDGFL